MYFLLNLFSFNIIAVFCGVLLAIYKYLTYHNDYWKKKNVPYKKPELFFGNLKDLILGRKSSGKIYQDIYNEFPREKYVGTFKTRLPELTIRDPDLIKCILVKDFNHFINRNEVISPKIEKMNENLFNVQGNKWKAMRQKMTPTFTSGKLRYMFPLVVEKAEEFQEFLMHEVKFSEEQEIKDLMARFTTDVIGSVAFGVQTNSIADENAPFRKMGKKIFETTPLMLLKIFFRLASPTLFEFLKMRIIDKVTEDFFIDLVKGIVDHRLKTKTKRNDFIDLMLELREKGFINVDGKDGEERIEFSDVFMTAQAFIFFAAGFETSSAVMSFTLYELAKNPDVQEKLISEIDAVLEKHLGKLSYDSINEMNYLECVVNETMRKYPALGNLTRICTSKYTLPGTDLTIDEDVNISIPTLALHYDPQYFPDPHKYKPERFLPEAKQERHPMVFLPFGDGPRNCIGLRFGKMQSMIGLASILSKFKVQESPKTEKKLVMNPRSFVTSCSHGVWVNLKPRY